MENSGQYKSLTSCALIYMMVIPPYLNLHGAGKKFWKQICKMKLCGLFTCKNGVYRFACELNMILHVSRLVRLLKIKS